MQPALPHGLLTLVCCAAALAAQRVPSVGDIMKRVGAYVDAYGERASIVVATESYEQVARDSGGAMKRRRIVAEFAIAMTDPHGWQGFRDVLEVDGKPLGDREDRLARALMAGPNGLVAARRLSDESARFNIGTVARNFNVPTTALFFFATDRQDRFKMSAKGVDDGLWHLTWRETYKPTFIRTPENTSLPTEGDLWVNPADGAVRRTRLKIAMELQRASHGVGSVDVTYQFVPAIGLWLPDVMEENWQIASRFSAWESVHGRAVYTNYRQFTTSGRIK